MKLLAAILPLLLVVKVSGFVADGSTEIIFPQAVRFSVNLTIPATQVTDASLTITWPGHDPVNLPVDVKQVSLVYGEPQARLIYLWTISDPPPLFSEVSYQWSFTAADGSTGTLNDSFVFADPRVDWVRSVDPQGQFNLTVPRNLGTLIDAAQQMRTLLEKNTGQTLHTNLLIYPMQPDCMSVSDANPSATAEPDATAAPCPSGLLDQLLAGYDLLVVTPDVTAEDDVASRLVQQAYAPLWDQKAVPLWFQAGLSRFYETSLKNALLPPVQQAARSRTLYNLSQMADASLPASALWQAQSYGMVLYIARQIGVSGLFKLAQVPADSFDAAYQQALTIPLTALIPAWQQWIFTRTAEGDYGITPYQPPTPSPTPSLTPSNTPTITLTPSSTATPTATDTATPFGVRTFVPAPTVTPRSTMTPLPPSTTPRPPGSLPTTHAGADRAANDSGRSDGALWGVDGVGAAAWTRRVLADSIGK